MSIMEYDDIFDFGFDNQDDLFNFGIVAMAMSENDQECKVKDLIDDVNAYRPDGIEASALTDMMRERGIEYPLLPQWLKDEIDDNICVY